MSKAVVTITARSKMMRARAGDISLPKICGMAFGDGGVDSNGVVIDPEIDQNILKSERYRKNIDGYNILNDTSCRYSCTLQLNELSGCKISEIALYDEDGDLVAIKNFSVKEKDNDSEMIFNIDDVF